MILKVHVKKIQADLKIQIRVHVYLRRTKSSRVETGKELYLWTFGTVQPTTTNNNNQQKQPTTTTRNKVFDHRSK